MVNHCLDHRFCQSLSRRHRNEMHFHIRCRTETRSKSVNLSGSALDSSSEPEESQTCSQPSPPVDSVVESAHKAKILLETEKLPVWLHGKEKELKHKIDFLHRCAVVPHNNYYANTIVLDIRKM